MKRLLSPKSIAVVGGGAWCENVISECAKIGFDGPVWPVHPTRDQMGGHPVFRSVEDLPEAPDATFIGVNRETTVKVVRRLKRRGAGGAICFASGFAEAKAEMSDGSDLQTALLKAAGDMPILGPNCYGLLNLVDGVALWPDQHGAVRVDKGVAIIAQSSNIAINLTMQRRGLPISHVATIGNQAQIDMAAIGTTLLEDPRVTALGLYIEGIPDLAAFEAMAHRAHALGKSIVAVKVGASDQARTAAISHTASLAGSAAGASALFRRLGIAEVSTLGAFLETLKVLNTVGPLPSHLIASMSCSGGEASLVADSALGMALEFPPLSVAQTTALAKALGSKVALANPLDYHTYIWADRRAMAECFAAMMQGDLALGMVVLDFPRSDRCDAEDWYIVIDAVSDAIERSGKPIALVASLPDTMPEDVAMATSAKGILAMSGLTEALAAFEAAASIAHFNPSDLALLRPGPEEDGYMLSEHEAKTLLKAASVVVPEMRQAASIAELKEVVHDLSAPFVLKGAGIAHKTEASAVHLGLQDLDQVEAAAGSMAASSFLLEEMVEDGVAELLVGVTLDPAHGFVLTIGAGGVLTEILQDTQSLLLPVSKDEIYGALKRLHSAPVLDGYRGKPAANLDAIVAAVQSVQSYVIAHQDDVLEVEVNPLIATPSRAVAVDALIRVRERS